MIVSHNDLPDIKLSIYDIDIKIAALMQSQQHYDWTELDYRTIILACMCQVSAKSKETVYAY